jgi:TIGR03009 family protein
MSVRTARLLLSSLMALAVVAGTLGARTAFAQNQPQTNPTANNGPSTQLRPAANSPQAGGAGWAGAPQQTQAQGGATPNAGMLPNGQPIQPQALPLAPPFSLTPQQQAELDELLTKWEKKNDSITLFICSFYRWEYDPAFTNDRKQPKAEAHGEVKYAAPDKGLFHDLESWDWVQDQSGRWQKTKAPQGMWWACDGKSTYEVHPDRKLITETPLPPALQGKAISEGPLPFVFGAKAAALKGRYYLRLVNEPALAQKNQVLLAATPKWQKDAGNFSRVELILDANELLPVAIQIFNPGANLAQQSRTVIQFDNVSVNPTWAKVQNLFSDFSKPTILGFKTEKIEPPMPPPVNPPQVPNGANGGVNQAQRPQNPRR